MSKIEISNLQPKGLNLFSDSESYLTQLSESELESKGGYWIVVATIAISLLAESW
jgi:hypothetical protein